MLYVFKNRISFLLYTFFLVTLLQNMRVKLKARSSHRRCSVKKGVFKNFAKFTGKKQCQSLSFNEVTGLRPSLKEGLWHRCFPVNLLKVLRQWHRSFPGRKSFYRTPLGDCFCKVRKALTWRYRKRVGGGKKWELIQLADVTSIILRVVLHQVLE